VIVELLRAWPHRFELQQVQLPAGSRVAEALLAAGWDDDAEVSAYAVYGLRVERSTPLQDGDRIELLRPLQTDPKDARRRRANTRIAGG